MNAPTASVTPDERLFGVGIVLLGLGAVFGLAWVYSRGVRTGEQIERSRYGHTLEAQRAALEAQHYRLIVQGNDNMDLRRELEALGAREPPPQVVADASSEEAEET